MSRLEDVVKTHWTRLLDPTDHFKSAIQCDRAYPEITRAQMSQYYLLTLGWQPECVVMFVSGRGAASGAFIEASHVCGAPKRIILCHLDGKDALVADEIARMLADWKMPSTDIVEFVHMGMLQRHLESLPRNLLRVLAYVHGVPSQRMASTVAAALKCLADVYALVTVFADTYDLDYYPASYIARLRSWRGYRSDIPSFRHLAECAVGVGGTVSSPEADIRHLLTKDLPSFLAMQNSLKAALGAASPLLGTHWAYCVNAAALAHNDTVG